MVDWSIFSLLPLIKQLNQLTQTAKQTNLRVQIRMDIPAQFFMPDTLCRTKGDLTLAVPLAPVWIEKQPRLFFWRPFSHFHSQWEPDPYFRLTDHRVGVWVEVEYDLSTVIDFAVPVDPTENRLGPLPIQRQYQKDLRQRLRRVLDWILDEAWPSMKSQFADMRETGGSGSSRCIADKRARREDKKTGGTGSPGNC